MNAPASATRLARPQAAAQRPSQPFRRSGGKCPAKQAPRRGQECVRPRFPSPRPRRASREHNPCSTNSTDSPLIMFAFRSSRATLSKRLQPAGSISRRAGDAQAAPRFTHSSRAAISVDVVPPMQTSAARAASPTVSTGSASMSGVSNHSRAKAARVSERREAQTILSNSRIVSRQRRALTPFAPTRPRAFCSAGQSHRQDRSRGLHLLRPADRESRDRKRTARREGPFPLSRTVRREIESIAGRRVDFEEFERFFAVVGQRAPCPDGNADGIVFADHMDLSLDDESVGAAPDDIDIVGVRVAAITASGLPCIKYVEIDVQSRRAAAGVDNGFLHAPPSRRFPGGKVGETGDPQCRRRRHRIAFAPFPADHIAALSFGEPADGGAPCPRS